MGFRRQNGVTDSTSSMNVGYDKRVFMNQLTQSHKATGGIGHEKE